MDEQSMIITKCLKCDKAIKTAAMKSIGDTYICGHCGCKHTVFYDEAEECWYPKTTKRDSAV